MPPNRTPRPKQPSQQQTQAQAQAQLQQQFKQPKPPKQPKKPKEPKERRRGRDVPIELKERVVSAFKDRLETKAEISRSLSLPWSTVHSILQRFSEEGTVQSSRQNNPKPPRNKRLNDEHVNTMIDVLNMNPDTTLVELQQKLEQVYPTLHPLPSLSTISRALNGRVRYTIQRLRTDSAAYNTRETMEARKAWIETLIRHDFDVGTAIYLDEAGFNLNISRTIGKASQARRPPKVARPTQKAPNLSVCVAVDALSGTQSSEVIQGTCTTEKLIGFLCRNVLPTISATPRRVFFMDSGCFHNHPDVQRCIEASGHRLCLLPPYSPWFNLSEWTFGKVKTVVSRSDLDGRSSLEAAIAATINQVSPQDCQRWLQEVRRWIAIAAKGHPLGDEHKAPPLSTFRTNGIPLTPDHDDHHPHQHTGNDPQNHPQSHPHSQNQNHHSHSHSHDQEVMEPSPIASTSRSSTGSLIHLLPQHSSSSSSAITHPPPPPAPAPPPAPPPTSTSTPARMQTVRDKGRGGSRRNQRIPPPPLPTTNSTTTTTTTTTTAAPPPSSSSAAHGSSIDPFFLDLNLSSFDSGYH